jgi:hypothetical protein
VAKEGTHTISIKNINIIKLTVLFHNSERSTLFLCPIIISEFMAAGSGNRKGEGWWR